MNSFTSFYVYNAEDTGAYKVATKTSNVTTTEGVKVEVTTPEDSITSTKTITKVDESNSTKTQTIITSGGGVTTSERANTAEKGFTGRPIWVLEEITEDDFTFNDNSDYEIELKHTPLGISWVRGWNDSSTNKYKWIN